MRKFVYSLVLFCIFSVSTVAQSISKEELVFVRDLLSESIKQHLTVKGIELKPGMKMVDMLNYALEKGWKKTEDFDMCYSEFSVYDLNGSFYNRSFCNIKIKPLESDKSIVDYVAIAFPNVNSFKQLKNDYDRLKTALSEKYVLFNSEEFFDNKNIEESNSDILKLNALENDECKFQSTFYLNDDPAGLLGYIRLTISCVKVEYIKQYH